MELNDQEEGDPLGVVTVASETIASVGNKPIARMSDSLTSLNDAKNGVDLKWKNDSETKKTQQQNQVEEDEEEDEEPSLFNSLNNKEETEGEPPANHSNEGNSTESPPPSALDSRNVFSPSSSSLSPERKALQKSHEGEIETALLEDETLQLRVNNVVFHHPSAASNNYSERIRGTLIVTSYKLEFLPETKTWRSSSFFVAPVSLVIFLYVYMTLMKQNKKGWRHFHHQAREWERQFHERESLAWEWKREQQQQRASDSLEGLSDI